MANRMKKSKWDYTIQPDETGMLQRTFLQIPVTAKGFVIETFCNKMGGTWVFDCRNAANGWGIDLTYSSSNNEWHIGTNTIDKSSLFVEKGIYGKTNRTMYLGGLASNEPTVYIEYLNFKWVY